MGGLLAGALFVALDVGWRPPPPPPAAKAAASGCTGGRLPSPPPALANAAARGCTGGRDGASACGGTCGRGALETDAPVAVASTTLTLGARLLPPPVLNAMAKGCTGRWELLDGGAGVARTAGGQRLLLAVEAVVEVASTTAALGAMALPPPLLKAMARGWTGRPEGVAVASLGGGGGGGRVGGGCGAFCTTGTVGAPFPSTTVVSITCPWAFFLTMRFLTTLRTTFLGCCCAACRACNC